MNLTLALLLCAILVLVFFNPDEPMYHSDIDINDIPSKILATENVRAGKHLVELDVESEERSANVVVNGIHCVRVTEVCEKHWDFWDSCTSASS